METVCGQFLLSHANHVPKDEKKKTVERYIRNLYFQEQTDHQTINKTMPCDGIPYINIPLKNFQQFFYFSLPSNDHLEDIL